MSAWARGHLRAPYLAASVEQAGEGAIRLDDGARTVELVVEGDADAACALLRALTDPHDEVWADLASEGPEPLRRLVADLDRIGWVREADGSGQEVARRRREGLDALVGRARRWLGTAPEGWAVGDDRGLAADVLRTCRSSWRRTSPLAEQVLGHVLDGTDPPVWDGGAVAMCDPGDVEAQVWAGLQLAVLRGADDGPARHHAFVPTSFPDGPGVNVLVAAEERVEALLADVGAPGVDALLAEAGGAERAAPIVFPHRWFQTIRYVDAVAGLLRFHLGAELRDLVRTYLREEMGHEVHELETCRELGLTDEDLAGFAPLPWFAAHPELLVDLADRRPLSFLLAVTVAEGLPGAGRTLTEQIARGGGSPTLAFHDHLDRELGHEMVTRTLLGQVGWVDGADACAAIGDLLRVVEVAHAGWRSLGRWSAAGLPPTPRPFGLSAAELLALDPPR